MTQGQLPRHCDYVKLWQMQGTSGNRRARARVPPREPRIPVILGEVFPPEGAPVDPRVPPVAIVAPMEQVVPQEDDGIVDVHAID